ncbi:hypothetical protein EZV62_005742 [Acer yangbiense]|uniref:BHLH domain-containing protein n=1 Tax=Acer yangbiense TaxID=1000413 RepID=A0A5C7IN49_9ROSI|nr:hypothetical protein EZV62_005742 [Acer yangbiense]
MSEEKNTSAEDIKKKMTHKDTEKQRRQEMSTLHASLRTLLPLEYIKGKRSMSDHMNGAVYYINDLKNKIKELSDKRDELIKRVSNSSASSSRRESAGGSRNDHDQPPSNCVMIHPCFGGLEIVISSTSFMREQENNNYRISNNVLEKKIVRKENERLRRQHMSMLNASLRSLLPLESIKGKRSICDHIDEAVKYINYLDKNIQDLSIKRDKLKNFLDLEADRLSNQLGNTSSENCVSVRSPYCGGVEIVISCGGLREESCSLLSRVLEVVVEEGLDTVQCVSSQTDDGVFHTVLSEPFNSTTRPTQLSNSTTHPRRKGRSAAGGGATMVIGRATPDTKRRRRMCCDDGGNPPVPQWLFASLSSLLLRRCLFASSVALRVAVVAPPLAADLPLLLE